MSDFDLHGSHLPILIRAIQKTSGHRPVLELGMGWSSTPTLHWMCADLGRKLVSCESDPKWLQNFIDYQSDNHTIKLVENWQVQGFEKTHWSVVLIDQRPALQRHRDAINLAHSADIVILHDTQPETDRFYAYRRVWEHYKYRYDYTKFLPHTTAVSNYIDVAKELSI